MTKAAYTVIPTHSLPDPLHSPGGSSGHEPFGARPSGVVAAVNQSPEGEVVFTMAPTANLPDLQDDPGQPDIIPQHRRAGTATRRSRKANAGKQPNVPMPDASATLPAPANKETEPIPFMPDLEATSVGEEGQPDNGDHKPFADLPLATLHALLGHYARLLADVQKTRIAMGNRVAAMERDGLPEQWRAPAQKTVDDLATTERAVSRQLERLAKQHFMADWIAAQRGIGLGGFARLLGITGPLDQFATVSKLWRYLGMAVDDGHAPKKVKGEKLNYSPAGRVLCHQIAESIVKVGKGGAYRDAYDAKKAEYEAGRPDWTPLHRHNAAMRYAIKQLLKAMWVEWRERQAAIAAAKGAR